MKYDPVKTSLGCIFNSAPWMRKLFYRLLDLFLLRTWHIRKEIKRWAASKNDSCNILDAGCGFGQYTYFLATFKPGWSVNAVDINPLQVDDCHRFFQKAGIHNASFGEADLTKYTRENEFDLIVSVDVMEHIEDDNGVFRNFHASLKPGGMLLISTPSDQGGSDAHDHDDPSFIEEHVRNGYNINEIKEKLEKAGFREIFARYSYGPFGSIAWRFTMKYPIMLVNISKIFLVLLPFYFLLLLPFILILSYADLNTRYSKGTGLIVKAWKTKNP